MHTALVRKFRAESGRIHDLVFTGLPWMAKGATEYKASWERFGKSGRV